MPLIQIKLPKGVISEEEKKEMIARVSDLVAKIEARPHAKEKLLPHTWCIINEVTPVNWGLGGQTLTLETIKALLES